MVCNAADCTDAAGRATGSRRQRPHRRPSRGLGGATVWATENLNANISGAGNVEYYGNPDVTTKISGLGNVTPKGSK